MDFKQLLSFVTVVDCQSFTRAAEQLYVSQPTISAHIHALEEELHTPLIIRTTKSIEVTQKGKSIYDDAVSILRIKDRMLQACASEQKRILRVAASTIPASYILPDILPEFGRLFPQIYFNIQRVENQLVLDGVAHGRFDLGFSTVEADDSLLSLPVCCDRMILITPVSSFYLGLQSRAELPILELLEQPIILREHGTAGLKTSDRYLMDLGYNEKDLSVVARANDQETVKNLVAAGMGVSLISERAARNFIQEKRVLSFELPVESKKNIYLVYRKTDAYLDHMKSFARFVQKKYASKDEIYF